MKAKASKVELVTAPRFLAANYVENAHTPICSYCQQSIDLLDDALCVIPGQWMADKSEGGAMFVLEPDVQVQIIQLTNGQMALRVDSHTANHVHAECQKQLVAEMFDSPWGMEIEEEDYR